MKWLISIPCWGKEYRRMFLQRGLPAILAAIEFAKIEQPHFVIYTDNSGELLEGMAARKIFGEEFVRFLPVPSAVNSTCRLGNADRATIHDAAIGEAIMFLNADMVVSREVFVACERAFAKGKIFVSCPSIRTKDLPPPIGASAADLLTWSWEHRHQFTEDCVWRRGQVMLPPYVIFEREKSVVMHAFDLQPLAIYKRRELDYRGPTASEIITMFSIDETHVVVSPDDVAIAEPASDDLPYGRFSKRKFSHQTVVNWGRHFTARIHHQQFRRQIVLIGKDNPTAWKIANGIADASDREIIRRGYLEIDNPFDPVDPRGMRPSILAKMGRVPLPVRHLVPKPIRQKILEWMMA